MAERSRGILASLEEVSRLRSTQTAPFQKSLTQQLPSDDHAHDFVGTFENAVDAQISEEALDRIILEIAVAAVELQRAVDN